MTPEQQLDILTRGTEEILPDGALLERLRLVAREGRPLRVKQGFDPTAPDIHLGHTVGLRKLRQFQELGHQVVVIVGDYTGMVGDPSGRSRTRPQLASEEIEENARTYLDQFFRVLERDPAPPLRRVEIRRNGEWFASMTFAELLHLASQYTVARLLERDDFAKRVESRQPIGVHELLYPLMQGYDSVAVRADVEMGGTDQKFNLLTGRVLQEAFGQEPQIALTMPMLPGLDGTQKMSKSLANHIAVTDPPGEMFGKVMSLPDHVMALYWRTVADLDEAALREVERQLSDPGSHPMILKKRLGARIVTLYHGPEAALAAQHDFDAQFSRRETPERLEEFGHAELLSAMGERTAPSIVDLLVASQIAGTRSAARRLLDQGAVSLDDQPVRQWDAPVDPETAHVVRGGRRMKRYVPSGARRQQPERSTG
jgi:tyrosyl-tRNA synthetase